MLVHLSKNEKGQFSFNPISVNLLTEVVKVVFALVVLLFLVSTASASGCCLCSLQAAAAGLQHGACLPARTCSNSCTTAAVSAQLALT